MCAPKLRAGDDSGLNGLACLGVAGADVCGFEVRGWGVVRGCGVLTRSGIVDVGRRGCGVLNGSRFIDAGGPRWGEDGVADGTYVANCVDTVQCTCASDCSCTVDCACAAGRLVTECIAVGMVWKGDLHLGWSGGVDGLRGFVGRIVWERDLHLRGTT